MSLSWVALVYYAYWLLVIYVTLQIIHQYTISSRASAWLFTVYFFPVGGVILYFIFGVKRRKRKMYTNKLAANQKSLEVFQKKFFQNSKDIIETYSEELNQFQSLMKMVYRDARSGLTVNNKITLLENGEKKFPALFEDIEQAKHTIHLEYYIYRFDQIGTELTQLLIKKAKAGVAVRFIYDDYGCLGLNESVLKRMRSHGIEAVAFSEINLFAFTERLNYRNHRKIVVIDNRIAYVGGINVGDEYNNTQEISDDSTYWRDTHIRIEGHAVSYLQNLFLNDWNFCTEQDIRIEAEEVARTQHHDETENKMCQVIFSGPDSPQPSILFAMLNAIHSAQTEILITTPYFIPNPSLIKALKIAVISGVKVKVLVPDHSDSLVVNAAAQSFYYELLEVGVEFYKYTKGFIHAKTMVIDGFLSVIGTANFDERSFELNFEVNVLVYDESFALQLRDSFEQDIANGKELTLESWDKRSKVKVFLEKSARLISPIL